MRIKATEIELPALQQTGSFDVAFLDCANQAFRPEAEIIFEAYKPLSSTSGLTKYI